ncbi:hypothetical protein [Paraglaciecola marina]|uniref:hypothetical protein n=1 Tax=Paraglaciecola marina TaxID=2500157 RepID=UPI00105D2DC0|nr:hypothetical protein [Paraglaciecola marina]
MSYSLNNLQGRAVEITTIGFADNRTGGSVTALPAFKVSAKHGLLLGQMARTPFEWSLKGYIRNDSRISHFLRLRTLVASGFFSLLFLAVEEK